MPPRVLPLARIVAGAALGLVVQALPAGAQSDSLTARKIGQVVDEVIGAVIPPDSSLSRVSVRERGLYFDYARTLAAFGHRDVAVPASALALKSAVMPGDRSLLDDCNQGGTMPCQRLGNSAYVFVMPESRSDSAMLVWLVVEWPDRGGATFTRGVWPASRAFLTGFSMEVFLTRAADGSWRFSRVGRARVSD